MIDSKKLIEILKVTAEKIDAEKTDIKDDAEKLPEWAKQFFRIRCNAESINV